MITAYRLPLLPGPIAALHLVPAAALTGMPLVIGQSGKATEALARLGVDVLFVAVAGLMCSCSRSAARTDAEPSPSWTGGRVASDTYAARRAARLDGAIAPPTTRRRPGARRGTVEASALDRR